MKQISVDMNAFCFPHTPTVGVLRRDFVRGNATYQWEYDTQSLLISRNSNEASLQELISASGDYMLSSDLAQRIVNEIVAAMRSWQAVAHQCGISSGELKRFAARIERFIP